MLAFVSKKIESLFACELPALSKAIDSCLTLPITAVRWGCDQAMKTESVTSYPVPEKYKMRNLYHHAGFINPNELFSDEKTQSVMMSLFCLKQALQKTFFTQPYCSFDKDQEGDVKEAFNKIDQTIKRLELFFILDHKDKDQLRLNDLLLTLDDFAALKKSMLFLMEETRLPLSDISPVKESLPFIDMCTVHLERYKFECLGFIDKKAKITLDDLHQLLDSWCAQNTHIIPPSTIDNQKELAFIFSLHKTVCEAKNEIDNATETADVYKKLHALYLSTNNREFNTNKLVFKRHASIENASSLATKKNQSARRHYAKPLFEALKKFHACFELKNAPIRFDLGDIEPLIHGFKKIRQNEPDLVNFVLDEHDPDGIIKNLMTYYKKPTLLEQTSPLYLPIDKIQNIDASLMVSSLFDSVNQFDEIHPQDILTAVQNLTSGLPINFYLTAHSIDNLVKTVQGAKGLGDHYVDFISRTLDDIKSELALWFIKGGEDATCLDLIELFNLKDKLVFFINDITGFDISIKPFVNNLQLSDSITHCISTVNALLFSIDRTSEIALSEVFTFSNLQAPPQTYLLQQKTGEAIKFIKSRSIIRGIDDLETKEILSVLSSINRLIKQFDTPEQRQPRMADHLIAKKRHKKITHLYEKLKDVCKRPMIELTIKDKVQAVISSVSLTGIQNDLIKKATESLSDIKVTINKLKAEESENKETNESNAEIISKLNANLLVIDKIIKKPFSTEKIALYFDLMYEWETFRFDIANSLSFSKNQSLYNLMTEYLCTLEELINEKSEIRRLKELLHECTEHASMFSMQLYYSGCISEDNLPNDPDVLNVIDDGKILEDNLPFKETERLFDLNNEFIVNLLDDKGLFLLGFYTEKQKGELIVISNEIKKLSHKMMSSYNFMNTFPSFDVLNSMLSLSRKCYQMHEILQGTKLTAYSHKSKYYIDMLTCLSALSSKMDAFCATEISSTLRANVEDLRTLHLELSYLTTHHSDPFKKWSSEYPTLVDPLLHFEQQDSIKLPEWISPWKVDSADFFTPTERENNFSALENKYKEVAAYFNGLDTFNNDTFIQSPDVTGRLMDIFLSSDPVDEAELKKNDNLLALKSEFELHFKELDPSPLTIPENHKILQFTNKKIVAKIASSGESRLSENEIRNDYRIVTSRMSFLIYAMTKPINSTSAQPPTPNANEITLDLTCKIEPLQIPWVRTYAKFLRSLILLPDLRKDIPGSTLTLFDAFYALLVKKYGIDFYEDLYLQPDRCESHI